MLPRGSIPMLSSSATEVYIYKINLMLEQLSKRKKSVSSAYDYWNAKCSGPISGPKEAGFVLKRTSGVHGFYGASSVERLPVEQAITTTIQQYKAIPMNWVLISHIFERGYSVICCVIFIFFIYFINIVTYLLTNNAEPWECRARVGPSTLYKAYLVWKRLFVSQGQNAWNKHKESIAAWP